jgi:uncharacterized protein YbaA (DUF1428 family)
MVKVLLMSLIWLSIMNKHLVILATAFFSLNICAMEALNKGPPHTKNAPRKMATSSPTSMSAQAIELLRRNIIDGDVSAVRKYIQAKGDVNVVFKDGMSCLNLAEKHHRFKICEMLVCAGASKTDCEVLEAEASKIELLRRNIIDGDVSAVERYIQAKGDVNVVFKDGMSCLSLAEKHRRFRAYEMLVRAGASKSVVKPKLERKPEQKALSNSEHLGGSSETDWQMLEAEASETDWQMLEEVAELDSFDFRGGYPDEGSD